MEYKRISPKDNCPFLCWQEIVLIFATKCRYKFATALGPGYEVLMFGVSQLLYTILTLLPVALFWQSYVVHTTFLLVMCLISVWNGVTKRRFFLRFFFFVCFFEKKTKTFLRFLILVLFFYKKKKYLFNRKQFLHRSLDRKISTTNETTAKTLWGAWKHIKEISKLKFGNATNFFPRKSNSKKDHKKVL